MLVAQSDVMSENDEPQEMVWVAGATNDDYTLTCYIFAKHESSLLDKILRPKKKVPHSKLWKVVRVSLEIPSCLVRHYGYYYR